MAEVSLGRVTLLAGAITSSWIALLVFGGLPTETLAQYTKKLNCLGTDSYIPVS